MVKRIAVMITSIACLIVLAGCSQPGGGVAAKVNGKVITEDSVQGASIALAEILVNAYREETQDYEEDLDVSQLASQFLPEILKDQITGAMLSDALAEVGIVFTDEDKYAWWVASIDEDIPFYQVWFDPRGREGFDGYVVANLAASYVYAGVISEDILEEKADQMTVWMNPRYGEWDMDNWYPSAWIDGLPGGVLADQVPFVVG
jgi:hypothetical protein